MKRHRDRRVSSGVVPPAIALGPCVEIWSRPEDRPPGISDQSWETFYARRSARRRHHAALNAWVLQTTGYEIHNVPKDLQPEGMWTGAPWSAETLAQTDPEELRERYRRAGWSPS
jgi:hypothetical protein